MADPSTNESCPQASEEQHESTTRSMKKFLKQESLKHEQEKGMDPLDPAYVLPKMPVPPLKSSLEKYLRAVKPLVTKEQFEETKKKVEEFGKPGGLGEILQDKLLHVREEKVNWVYEWWLDDMYMKNPLPLPVNSNPGMVFPRQNFTDESQALRFASKIISGVLDYKIIIDTRSLPTDRATSREKGQPLCMEQYYRLFNTYRIPGEAKDYLVCSENNLNPEPEHVIVACKNQFFVLDVVVNFKRLSEDNLYTQLKRITKLAAEEDAAPDPVGILTTDDRRKWAKSRLKLMTDSTNRDALDMIERCIFVLCLDESFHDSVNEREDRCLFEQMVHGQGTAKNSANRWFDKTVQFIVGKDGACGLCYEHSPAEGIAVIQLSEHLLGFIEATKNHKLPRMLSVCELPYPRRLVWKLTSDIQQHIEEASDRLNILVDRADFHVLRFNDYGKNFPKSQNMSPDSYIQLALQLTYYKLHGKLVSTYESASTRRFRNGRVDNIRACHLEALEWVQAMCEGQDTFHGEEKMHLLRKAMKAQTSIMTDNILGQGIDNHLLGLRILAEELKLPTPAIFSDFSYKNSNHFGLSTSQVPTKTDSYMGYGAVVPDGYGASYNPSEKNSLIFVISSFKDHPETDATLFAHTLENTLLQMKELCLSVCAIDGAAIVTNGPVCNENHVNGKVHHNDTNVAVKESRMNGTLNGDAESNGLAMNNSPFCINSKDTQKQLK